MSMFENKIVYLCKNSFIYNIWIQIIEIFKFLFYACFKVYFYYGMLL